MSLSSFEENLWIARIAEFENPRKMIFGVDCVGRVGVEAKQLGAGKALVVSDETIEKIGLLERVLAPLRAGGLEVEVHKIPVKEPDMASARAMAGAVRKSRYDVVVGVGGGSCLDSAKTAAAMATNPGDVSEYCARVKGQVRELEQRTLPKILIPTTSGTGSEASNTLVIIDEGYKTWITDNRLLAEVAMVDPTLALTMPPGLTAGTGMDALSHVTEALMSRRANPLSDAMAFEAVRLVFSNLRTAYFSGEDLEARWNMSMAATLGGWVIGFPWIGGPANLGHCIAEAMGSKYRIPHGVACALALPYTMEFNLPACTERLAEIASVVLEDLGGLSTYDMALQSVDAVLGLMEDIELPTSLRQVNFPEEDIPDFARYIVEERQYLYDLDHYNPRKLTLENTTQLLEGMWEGETAG